MPRLDDIEREAVAAALGSWGGDVERLKRAVLALHSARGGVLTESEMRALLARLSLPEPARLSGYVNRAARLGDAMVDAKTALHVAPVAGAAAASVAEKPAAALAEARQRLAVVGRLDNLASVMTVLAPLTRSVADMGAAAQYAVHRAANEATIAAAEATDSKTVFVPERDACVECQEQGGQTGDNFDVPPLHPWCRCEVHTYDDEDVPLALKRESVRSLLRGFSLPSESEAERLRAARKALASKPQAPASVKRYAEDALKRGEFPRSRRPGGDR